MQPPATGRIAPPASARPLSSPLATGHTWRARPLPAWGHLAGGPQRVARPASVARASPRPMRKREPPGPGSVRPSVQWERGMQMSRCGGGRPVKAAGAPGMLEESWAAAEQKSGLPAASSGLPPWPLLRPPPSPSHPPRSSGAWRPAPAGSAAGPASTTSLASCGTTRGASSCCGRGLVRMLVPTWTGRRTGTRPTRAAGWSSTTWASCKETLRYFPAAG